MAKLDRPIDAGRKPLGQILLEQGIISQSDLAKSLRKQKETGESLGQVLIQASLCSADDILFALAEQADMEIASLDSFEIPEEVIKLVDAPTARVFKVIPIEYDGKTLTVAMSDPHNILPLDDLRVMLGKDVRGALTTEDAIDKALEKYYPASKDRDMSDVLKDFNPDDLEILEENPAEMSLEEQLKLADAAPVIRMVNLMMLQAIRDQSSDIHFEPYEDTFRVRYRIDGALLETTPPPKQLAMAIISRIKVMAQMDIAERRIPQDNRIMLQIGGRPIDLRVSSLPTVFGESVVMRVLDRAVVSLDLERIGLRDDELALVREMIDLPNGIILVTGPTGSGKTTTLYSALNEANDESIKIITVEDPVEYDLDGIVQVPVNDGIGVTYAACLRSILRQDPDKILVGEIRDFETAQIAIEASLTGHVVFSTLHTNDAPSTITRLLDMGLEPFLVAATLECVVAQRLIRLICTKCKSPYTPQADDLARVSLTSDAVHGKNFYYGKGCEHCNKTGYRGRNAIFEMMRVTSGLRELIIKQESTEIVRAAAVSSGMRLLRDAGILKVFDGLTTIEEVVKETLAFT